MPTQKCPLCFNDAEFRGIDFGRKKKFDCNLCGVFVISPSTEEAISGIGQSQKAMISDASHHCEAGMLLLIYRDDTNNSIGWRCESEKEWS